MITCMGLFRGSRGGILPSAEVLPVLLAVATLTLEPMELQLEATLILDGEDVPV